MPLSAKLYHKYRKYKNLYHQLRGGSGRSKRSDPRRSAPDTSPDLALSREMARILSPEIRQEYPGLIDLSNNSNLDNVRSRLTRVENFRSRHIQFSEMVPLERPFPLMPPIAVPTVPSPVPVSWIANSGSGPGCDFYQVCGTSRSGESQITVLGSGSYGVAYGVKFQSRRAATALTDSPLPYQFILKLVAYEPTDLDGRSNRYHYADYPITNQYRPENVEVYTADLFRHLFVDRQECVTPHIMLPILALRCPYQDRVTLPVQLGVNSIYNLLHLLPSRQRVEIENIYQYNRKKRDSSLQQWATSPSMYQGPQGTIPGLDQITNPRSTRHTQKVARLVRDYLHSLNPNDDMLVYVSEFAGYGTLTEWMWPPKPELDWKIMCFQLMYTMAVIQDRIPDWRHNDMSPRNVLVQRLNVTEEDRGNGYLYQWMDQWYYLPVADFSLRLWDFDFANSSLLPNYKVATPKKTGSGVDLHFPEYGIIPDACPQYDLHFLWNYLTHYYQTHFRSIPSSVQQLIQEWLPEPVAGVRKPGSDLLTEEGRLTQWAQISRSGLAKVQTRVLDHTTGEHTIPYTQLTAEYQLTHHPIFQEFRVNEAQLQEIKERASRGDRAVVINTFRYPTPFSET